MTDMVEEMIELHDKELVLDHTKILVQLQEQVAASCRKILALEKFLLEKINSRDEEIRVAKVEMDRRMEKVDEIYLKVMTLESNSQLSKGAKKWEDHIVTVLIGAAVLLGVYLMTHGIKG